VYTLHGIATFAIADCHRRIRPTTQAVVAAETVAEFKRKLSNVDLSSFLRYNFNS